jgi:hypothetical protein
MISEQLLRDVVATMLQYAKHDREYAVALGNEIAALRDALQELSGGKFLPILEKHRARMQETTASLRDADSASYDELIQRVKTGQLF